MEEEGIYLSVCVSTHGMCVGVSSLYHMGMWWQVPFTH